MLTYHKKKDYEILCVFTLIGHLSQCIESYTAVKFTNYKTERIHSRQICKRVAKVKVALMENSPHLLGVHIHISWATLRCCGVTGIEIWEHFCLMALIPLSCDPSTKRSELWNQRNIWWKVSTWYWFKTTDIWDPRISRRLSKYEWWLAICIVPTNNSVGYFYNPPFLLSKRFSHLFVLRLLIINTLLLHMSKKWKKWKQTAHRVYNKKIIYTFLLLKRGSLHWVWKVLCSNYSFTPLIFCNKFSL